MKRRLKEKFALFKETRKPTAPPAKKFDDDKREQKIHPTLRKAKHKKKVEENGDL